MTNNDNPLLVLLEIRKNYEAVRTIYERMPLEDLRLSYALRTGWEKELIKAIGIKRNTKKK